MMRISRGDSNVDVFVYGLILMTFVSSTRTGILKRSFTVGGCIDKMVAIKNAVLDSTRRVSRGLKSAMNLNSSRIYP